MLDKIESVEEIQERVRQRVSEFSSKRDYQTAQSADGQLKVPTPIDGSTPIKLTFKDVCYEVTVKKSKQEKYYLKMQ